METMETLQREIKLSYKLSEKNKIIGTDKELIAMACVDFQERTEPDNKTDLIKAILTMEYPELVGSNCDKGLEWETKLTIPLEYLERVLKIMRKISKETKQKGYNDHVTLKVKANYPLCLEFEDTGTNDKIIFVIAPRMDDGGV